MSDPSYPAYPILAFSASFLVLVPLSWHLQAWNAGTCLYMAWTSLACLNFAINSVIWHGNAINFAPVWCNISSRIIVATAVAIPASSLCIVRRLYKISSMSSAGVTIDEKRKAVYVDLAIGVGLPVLQLIMQYIVSGHQYDIYGDIGCYPFTYNTPVAYPLSITWPVVIGVVSLVYSVLTLRAFIKRRATLSILFSSNKSLTAHRYLRLMALAVFEALCTIPLSSYGMYLNIKAGLQPWISWEDTHFDYSQVDQIPSVLWRMDRNSVISLELSRWLPVFCALVFFCFFGFAEEARRNYVRVAHALAEHCHLALPARSFRFSGLQSRRTVNSSRFSSSLPSYTSGYPTQVPFTPTSLLSTSETSSSSLPPYENVMKASTELKLDARDGQVPYVAPVLEYTKSSSMA